MASGNKNSGLASSSKPKPYVLVVDDSDDDVFLLSRALRKMGVNHPIECAVNGVEGMKYFKALLAEGPESGDFPSLVILDLKMPLVDGHELLAWIRSQPALKKLAVYVLSSSIIPGDVSASIQFGALDHWTKPCSMREYFELAAKIKNLLPPRAEAA
ncbi:MAG TPA: response regulator [Candidatus Saccharimonadales bacterium]|nr:response regulator [Candidatus Saccharimonadales bacterium]